ncbi:MAG: SLAC1 anion channel family protein [Burkholderiaceae bacterium]|nr:SLAC1 anion channel family protein [Burkholderiaceae bacterium]
MTAHAHPLKYLLPGWYALVMGLSGLALAWHRAQPLMGEMAGAIALVLGGLAAVVFVLLAAASLLRWQRHPEAWAEDRRHPVRHAFIAALPISLILLATVAVVLFGASAPARALWWAGALGQLWVTLWVLGRWWRPATAGGAAGGAAGGLSWAGVTPALFMPIVGNVLLPLAGVPLGQADWAAAQFGIGLMFWPVVLVLLVVRIAQQGLWPERLLPTSFIAIAPPAVIGLSALQLGAPLLLGWMLWGMALFCAAWVALLAPRIRNQPFALTHWGLSFPLAALAALTLRLATPGGLLAVLGPLLLALASLVILGLLLATVRGLRDGTLLAPEPVAAIVPAAP